MNRELEPGRWRLALSIVVIVTTGCNSSPPRFQACTNAWHVVYQSQPGELAPTWGDLAWRGGTLFVAHSAAPNATASPGSFLFSMPDHGGQTTRLVDGGVRHFWLEGDNLIFGELTANTLETVPQGGGIPTQIVQYGQSDAFFGQLLTPLVLDGSAFYWLLWDNNGGIEVQRHFRGGGDDALLGTIPFTSFGYDPVWAGQVADNLVFGFTNMNLGAAVLTVPKGGGTPVQLPVSNPTRSIPLAASSQGALLYSESTEDATDPKTGASVTHYDLLLGHVDGARPAAFSTTMPRTVVPSVGWAAASGAWYLAGTETDGRTRYDSIWSIAASGSASRVGCHAAFGPDASPFAVTPSWVSAAVVADGAVFVSLAFMDGTWQIARIDNGDASPDIGDGGMPTPDGSFDGPPPAACLPGAPALATGLASHSIQEIPLPSPDSGPGEITLGSDGNLWFTELQTSKLGRLTPAGCLTEFATGYHPPEGLTAGPDGALWFTEPGEAQIGHMTTGGLLQEFKLPATADNPYQIVAGPDGNLWFTDPLAGAVGRMTTAGVGIEYPTPTKLSNPLGIAAGTDGMLYVVEGSRNTIARVDPSGGAMTEILIPNGLSGSIAAGPDGDIWFGESQSLTQLKADGTVTSFPLPGVTAISIVSGPDDNLWFATGDAIGQMVLSTHAVTTFPIPTANSDTNSVTVGPDGSLWFAENAGNQIGLLKL